MSNSDSWYDPPEQPDLLCGCGHRESEHDERNELDNDSAYELLERLEGLVDYGNSTHSLVEIHRLLTRQLSVCGGKNCDCTEFAEEFDEEEPERV